MSRRLLFINAALVAASVLGLWRFQVEYRKAKQRYGILTQRSAAPGLPAQAAAPPSQPVQPVAYLDAAEKYLFSPDRNPTVVVEPPKLKPRPTLPQLFGVMNLGGGPIAIMAPDSTTRHKSVRVGEKIGEFTLLAAAADAITLEWEGEKIQAQVSDLLVRPAPPGGAAASGEGAATAPPPASGGSTTGSAPTVLNPSASTRPGEYLIGPAMQGSSGTIYQSPAGDTAPHGTVYQNKRKVVRTTPFGTQSWWEDIRQ